MLLSIESVPYCMVFRIKSFIVLCCISTIHGSPFRYNQLQNPHLIYNPPVLSDNLQQKQTWFRIPTLPDLVNNGWNFLFRNDTSSTPKPSSASSKEILREEIKENEEQIEKLENRVEDLESERKNKTGM